MTRNETRQPFNVRAFVSVGLVCAGLGLPWTGLANHMLQQEPMTVARHAWMSAHNSLGLLFAIFAVWHAVLNQRALLTYIHGPVLRLAARRREALYGLAIVALPTAVAIGHAFHVAGPRP